MQNIAKANQSCHSCNNYALHVKLHSLGSTPPLNTAKYRDNQPMLSKILPKGRVREPLRKGTSTALIRLPNERNGPMWKRKMEKQNMYNERTKVGILVVWIVI